MATVNEAEFDQRVSVLRESFEQYQGTHIYSPQLTIDFPKPGILFFDCLPIFENPQTFNLLVIPPRERI